MPFSYASVKGTLAPESTFSLNSSLAHDERLIDKVCQLLATSHFKGQKVHAVCQEWILDYTRQYYRNHLKDIGIDDPERSNERFPITPMQLARLFGYEVTTLLDEDNSKLVYTAISPFSRDMNEYMPYYSLRGKIKILGVQHKGVEYVAVYMMSAGNVGKITRCFAYRNGQAEAIDNIPGELFQIFEERRNDTSILDMSKSDDRKSDCAENKLSCGKFECMMEEDIRDIAGARDLSTIDWEEFISALEVRMDFSYDERFLGLIRTYLKTEQVGAYRESFGSFDLDDLVLVAQRLHTLAHNVKLFGMIDEMITYYDLPGIITKKAIISYATIYKDLESAGFVGEEWDAVGPDKQISAWLKDKSGKNLSWWESQGYGAKALKMRQIKAFCEHYSIDIYDLEENFIYNKVLETERKQGCLYEKREYKSIGAQMHLAGHALSTCMILANARVTLRKKGYELYEFLGRGYDAVLFKATGSMGRYAVAKIYTCSDYMLYGGMPQDPRKRFYQLRELKEEISFPTNKHIAPIHDVMYTDDMKNVIEIHEYVTGPSLFDLIGSGREEINIRERVKLAMGYLACNIAMFKTGHSDNDVEGFRDNYIVTGLGQVTLVDFGRVEKFVSSKLNAIMARSRVLKNAFFLLTGQTIDATDEDFFGRLRAALQEETDGLCDMGHVDDLFDYFRENIYCLDKGQVTILTGALERLRAIDADMSHTSDLAKRREGPRGFRPSIVIAVPDNRVYFSSKHSFEKLFDLTARLSDKLGVEISCISIEPEYLRPLDQDFLKMMSADLVIPVREDISMDELIAEMKSNFYHAVKTALYLNGTNDSFETFNRSLDNIVNADIARAGMREGYLNLRFFNMLKKVLPFYSIQGDIGGDDPAVPDSVNMIQANLCHAGEVKMLAEYFKQLPQYKKETFRGSNAIRINFIVDDHETKDKVAGDKERLLDSMGVSDVICPGNFRVMTKKEARQLSAAEMYDDLELSEDTGRVLMIYPRDVFRDDERQGDNSRVIFAGYEDIATLNVFTNALSALFSGRAGFIDIPDAVEAQFEEIQKQQILEYSRIAVSL